jgi:GTPase involved in cell partitioning and DNA repair
VPAYISQKLQEKQRLEEEIQKARTILDQENVDIRTIEEFKKLEDELKKYGLSMKDPRKLVSVLQQDMIHKKLSQVARA